MNDNYKELYYFLFNKISDMIQELQQLQQQAEEAYVAGFGHAPQSAAQENSATSAISLGDCYVPPKVTVSHVYVPDNYEDETIMSDDIGDRQQQDDECELGRCQTMNGSKTLAFERRKAAGQHNFNRRKPTAQPEERDSAKVLKN